ncbi:MAG: hypothetical protein LBQ50_12050 [Planctomycetaceae bacterium]|jgi:hypothetical protein|nr:hypothetical protein [Planctomycetaceae bacterium]
MDTQSFPFVMTDGKNGAVTEKESELLPEPVIFQKLTSPPRDVSILVQIHLLLNNRFASYFFWFFVYIGMIMCIIFLPAIIPNWMYWNFQPAGEGEIIDIQETTFELNEQRVFKFSFKQPDGNTGQSYATGKKFKNGDSVKQERSG